MASRGARRASRRNCFTRLFAKTIPARRVHLRNGVVVTCLSASTAAPSRYDLSNCTGSGGVFEPTHASGRFGEIVISEAVPVSFRLCRTAAEADAAGLILLGAGP